MDKNTRKKFSEYQELFMEFLLELLTNENFSNVIRWTIMPNEFEIINSDEVARLWGMKRAHNASLNHYKMYTDLWQLCYKGVVNLVDNRVIYRFNNSFDIIKSANTSVVGKQSSRNPSITGSIELKASEDKNCSSKADTVSVKSNKSYDTCHSIGLRMPATYSFAPDNVTPLSQENLTENNDHTDSHSIVLRSIDDETPQITSTNVKQMQNASSQTTESSVKVTNEIGTQRSFVSPIQKCSPIRRISRPLMSISAEYLSVMSAEDRYKYVADGYQILVDQNQNLLDRYNLIIERYDLLVDRYNCMLKFGTSSPFNFQPEKVFYRRHNKLNLSNIFDNTDGEMESNSIMEPCVSCLGKEKSSLERTKHNAEYLGKCSGLNDFSENDSPDNDIPGKCSPANDIPGNSSPVNDILGKSSPVNDILGKSSPVNDILGKNSPVNDILGKSSPVNDILGKSSPANDILGKSSPANDIPGKSSPANESNDNPLEISPANSIQERNSPSDSDKWEIASPRSSVSSFGSTKSANGLCRRNLRVPMSVLK